MFRIHWKGCPHRRLPRIRLPPLRSSLSRARLAQDASEAVNLLPFNSGLKKAREKERIRARRRRIRSRTRSHSGNTTVSLTALRNIEIFGWDSLKHFDSLGAENIKTGSKGQGFLDSSKDYQIVGCKSPVPKGLVGYSDNRPRPHMDGAASSKTPSNLPGKANIPRERRFTPAYWNKRKRSERDILPSVEPSRVATFGQNRVSGTYLPHFSTADPTQTAPTPVAARNSRSIKISTKRVPIKGVPITNAPSSRSRAYDRKRVIKSPSASGSPDLPPSITSKAISRTSKRHGWTSPEFRSALNSVINQQRESSKEQKVEFSDIDVTEPSRTSSEQRALEKFTSELAKSLANPEKLRRPTQPSTAPSIYTIEDLQPYAPQFRAAGLSVTFQDQVLTSPRLRQIKTPVKSENIPYTLQAFSFERRKAALGDGPANMQNSAAKPSVWISQTPTDYTSSSGSDFTEGHHHVRRIKANPAQVLPRQLPPNPPRPVTRTKTGLEGTNPKVEKKVPPKAPEARSPSDFTSSSGTMSWTEGHHHVKTVRMDAQPKPVMKEVKYADMTPTPAPRKASTKVMPLTQSPRKSIPWLQTSERSPSMRTNGPTAWQEENILSPDVTTSESSSVITIIDWSPIEDPRANLDVFPLVARPTGVEWVEMSYDRGRQSNADPAMRVVDMKKRSEWEETEPKSTVEIMPIDKSKETRMIVPVNVISITPVSSAYSFTSSRNSRLRIPERPLLCTQCGRLLVSPPPVLPPVLTKQHDCTKKSSTCEECAPSNTEVPLSGKRISTRPEPPSPTGTPPPPIIPVRTIRRTGTLFHPPPTAASLSLEASKLHFPRFDEIVNDYQSQRDDPSDKIVKAGKDEVLQPSNAKQANPISNSNNVSNGELPSISQTKVSNPKRMPPTPVAVSNRGSIDTIAEIILHYSAAESRSETTTPVITSDAHSPRDEDIFRGLQVVTLAACDKDVDMWIKDMSGPGIRKFLADVGAFEKLGIRELSRQARRTARKRRRELTERNKEKETDTRDAAQDQNDGVAEESDGSGSTVKARKIPDTSTGNKMKRDKDRNRKLDVVAEDEPVYHASSLGMEAKKNRLQDEHRVEEAHEEWCYCNDERKLDKGKGKEREGDELNHENVRSRRDRFRFRDGGFHH